jgi:hypothetical protein
MFGNFPFITPDAMRDYFQTTEEWEDYCRRYESWMAQVNSGEDPHVLIGKKKTTRVRCMGCGKYMSLFDAHINAINGHWHMNEYCLGKLVSLLEQNVRFSWQKKRFT